MKLIAFLLRCAKGVPYARTIMAMVILTSIIGGAATTASLAVINAALTHETTRPPHLFWAFVGFCLLLAFSRIVSQVLLLRFSTRVLFDMRMQMCRRILSVPLRKLEQNGPHRLLATLTDDIGTISSTLSAMPQLCTHLTILICSVFYLIWLSWSVFLIIITFMVLGICIYHFAVRKALVYTRLAREEWDALFNHFRGLIDGTKELKLHRDRRGEFLSHNLEATSTALRRNEVVANTIYIYANYWSQILSFVVIGLLIFALPALGGVNMQIITAYTFLFIYMLGPLQAVLHQLPAFGQARVAVGKVESLGLSLVEQSSEVDSAPGEARGREWKRLELVDVTHAYHRERENSSFILGPINLTLYPRELVFVTGGNGSGKTTLVKLLTGLYAPEQGELRLDGQPITDGNRDFYRQHFSAVFSDFYLFDSLLGLGAAKLDERAGDYLSQLHLEHKVSVKDGVLSTTALSQGQRKRLALLTAYLEDRPIYVFDEWAADQDPQFKEIFYLQLLPELKNRGKTVVVISHDDRYYDVADRVVKLDYGRINYDSYNKLDFGVPFEDALCPPVEAAEN